MTRRENPEKDAGLERPSLRDRAEAVACWSPSEMAEIRPEALQALLHELQVAQTELEMQNEELRRAQGELVGSREKYVELFDHAPVGYLTVDERGLIIEANLTAAALLLTERQALRAKPFALFVAPQDQDAWYLLRKKLFDTGVPQSKELRVRREGGGAAWMHLDATAARTEARDLACRMTLTDVSERKKLEEQLWQAAKTEALGRLAGGVAHDFNNMATVILNCCRFLSDGLPADEPLLHEVALIRAAGDRASLLTRQLLAFSRQQTLAPVRLDLNAELTDLERMLRRILGEDVALELVLDESLGRISADPGQIGQVIVNLVVNARDAMPRGGSLLLTTRNADLRDPSAAERAAVKPGEYIELTVADTGCGMDQATRERCFEPFFSKKPLGVGTGLGLSMVPGFIEQSGGQIAVQSSPGVGTTFTVLLPRVAGRSTGSSAPPAATLQRGSETVLVVEDEQAVRNVVERMLQSAGYHVLCAASGSEAIRQCEQHQDRIHRAPHGRHHARDERNRAGASSDVRTARHAGVADVGLPQ